MAVSHLAGMAFNLAGATSFVNYNELFVLTATRYKYSCL